MIFRSFTRVSAIFLVWFATTPTLFSQPSEVGNWFIYVGNQAFNKRWNWHNEMQYRNYNLIGDLQQLIVRTGIGYNLSENNNNLLMGYAFVHSQQYLPISDDKTGFDEHRLFQQFITRQHFGRWYLQHRYRLEERFLEDDFQTRFRYFLALNLPINQKTMADKAIYLSWYGEVFINGQAPLYSQTRLYGALGWMFSPHFRIEAGFMSQILETTARNQFQVALFNQLPLYRQD